MHFDTDEGNLEELNNILSILTVIFPSILPEVFRELIRTFDGYSRLHVIVEQLLRHQDQWVRGRWRIRNGECQAGTGLAKPSPQSVNAADQFRRASYKGAVRRILHEEFKVLSKSKIEAVLAEENFCYSRTRPTLQKLASKSWRSALSSLLAKWRKPADPTPRDDHVLVWLTTRGDEGMLVPSLRETGDVELDLELRQQVLEPFLQRIKEKREADDLNIAKAINEAEAKDAGGLYECECCYSDTTFEQMAFCTTEEHVICFQCIWRAVNEVLFGQSWGQNIDHDRAQLRCLAPVSVMSCQGCIPQDLTRRAILQSPSGMKALTILESRLAVEAISKCSLSLIHCPFCNYVEVDDPYFLPNAFQYRLDTSRPRVTFLLLLVMLSFFPLLVIYDLATRIPLCREFPRLAAMFRRSKAQLSRKNHLSRCFQCRSPFCGMQSCLTCLKAWHDPHICYESATLSLRTTVEAARTAALKRTCPRCGLGFIKDSGCNKLTCVCGYAMCYICRQGLDRGDGGEGYRHFCQHFRVTGGMCKECDKCDLYKNEDGESLVAKAGALAEKEWREREGMMGVEGIAGGQDTKPGKPLWNGDWTIQALLDWWVGQVLVC